MSVILPVPLSLPVTNIKVELAFDKDFTVNKFCGELIRTAFGKALLEMCCLKYRNDIKIDTNYCKNCDFVFDCPYPALFKVPNFNENFKRFNQLPSPFIISPAFEVPSFFNRDRKFLLDVSLIGTRAAFWDSTVLDVIDRMGKNLLFDKRVYLSVYDVVSTKSFEFSDFTSDIPDQDSCSVELKFNSPLTLISNNKKNRQIDFADIWYRLVERMVLLADIYGDGVSNHESVEHFKELGKSVVTDFYGIHSFKFYKNEKRGRSFFIPAMRGKIVFSNVPSFFVPFLRFGELMHVGSNISMGFGKYRLKFL